MFASVCLSVLVPACKQPFRNTAVCLSPAEPAVPSPDLGVTKQSPYPLLWEHEVKGTNEYDRHLLTSWPRLFSSIRAAIGSTLKTRTLQCSRISSTELIVLWGSLYTRYTEKNVSGFYIVVHLLQFTRQSVTLVDSVVRSTAFIQPFLMITYTLLWSMSSGCMGNLKVCNHLNVHDFKLCVCVCGGDHIPEENPHKFMVLLKINNGEAEIC